MDKIKRLIALCILSTLCFSTPAMAFANDTASPADSAEEITVEQNDAEDNADDVTAADQADYIADDEIPSDATHNDAIEDEVSQTEQARDDTNVVEPYAVSEGLQIEAEARPAMNAIFVKAAATASPNGSFSDTLSKSYMDSDHTMNLTKSGRLTLNVNTNISSGRIYIYKDSAQGSSVDSWSINSGDTKIVADLTAGKYIIRFYNYSTGKYTIKTSFVSANETYTYANDTISAVRGKSAISFGTRINGQLALNDEQDYYKVTLPSAGRLSVKIHSDIKDSISFSVFDEQEYSQHFTYMYTGDKTVALDLTAGNYYLEFYDYGDTGNYNFTATFKSAGETFTYSNDTINAVRVQTAVKMGQSVNGQLAINDDTDFYKLYVPSKGKYYLNVNSGIENVSISLYDSNESRVYATNGDYGMSKGSKKYIYELTKGTYYLRFNSYSYTGNYKFSMISSKATAPKNVKLTGLKKGKKKITVNWKKVSCSGYEIQCARNKAFTRSLKTVNVKKSSTVKKTVKKLKAGKTYYVRVRAYRNVGGTKKYGKWSTVKKIRTR